VIVDAKVAKDWIVLSTTSFQDRGTTRVVSDLSVDIPDLPLFMRGILGENPQLANATGNLSFASKISLNDWQWNRLDAEVWLKSIRLSTNEINLQQKFTIPQVKIRDGKVSHWNVRLDAPDIKLASQATGDFRQNLIIKNDFLHIILNFRLR
jgi:hypothetical protein